MFGQSLKLIIFVIRVASYISFASFCNLVRLRLLNGFLTLDIKYITTTYQISVRLLPKKAVRHWSESNYVEEKYSHTSIKNATTC